MSASVSCSRIWACGTGVSEAVVKWSRGMKQKLAIARPLLHRPALVFLDEPTAGLDPVAAAGLRDDLAGLASQQGATIFLTTHNMAEAEKLCNLVAVVRQGKLLAVGSPAELRSRGGGQRTEIAGRGFSEAMLATLRQQASVSQASIDNGRLMLVLNDGVGGGAAGEPDRARRRGSAGGSQRPGKPRRCVPHADGGRA